VVYFTILMNSDEDRKLPFARPLSSAGEREGGRAGHDDHDSHDSHEMSCVVCAVVACTLALCARSATCSRVVLCTSTNVYAHSRARGQFGVTDPWLANSRLSISRRPHFALLGAPSVRLREGVCTHPNSTPQEVCANAIQTTTAPRLTPAHWKVD
jgi:hypothetical protein